MNDITLLDILDMFSGTIHVVSVYGEEIFFGSKDDFYSFDYDSVGLFVTTIEADPSTVDTVLVTVY